MEKKETKEELIHNWYGWLKNRMPDIFEMWTKLALTQVYEEGQKSREAEIDELKYLLLNHIENTIPNLQSEIDSLRKDNERKDKMISGALKFIQEKRPTTPGLGALEIILGKFQ